MKTIHPILFLAVFAGAVLAAPVAKADPKPTIWGWWSSHWEKNDYEPYLEPGKEPHNTQWDHKVWKPGDWVAQTGSVRDLIDGFYTAEILTDQYVEDNVAVLEVGPNFYHLSGQDKRRVAALIDEAYNITASKQDGMFMLYDWRTKKPIGVYTAQGLQIQ